MSIGYMNQQGTLSAKIIRASKAPLFWRISNAMRPSFILGLLAVLFAKLFSFVTGIPTLTAQLAIIKVDGATGKRTNYGVVGYRVVTTAFVNFLTDQFQVDSTEIGDFKYHDSGVGTTAENAADTAIETTDGESRATGTQTEAAANAYQSVGTIAYTTTKAITEHGLFSQSTGGTLMDRTVFSAINVVNGDSIQFTYTLTLNSGG